MDHRPCCQPPWHREVPGLPLQLNLDNLPGVIPPDTRFCDKKDDLVEVEDGDRNQQADEGAKEDGEDNRHEESRDEDVQQATLRKLIADCMFEGSCLEWT